jgi:hypothetical protein
MEQRWSNLEGRAFQEGSSNAETLSLFLRLRAFALNHFERKNYFLRKNLEVSDILCIFACN